MLPTNRLGQTDLDITRLGLGAWAIGGGEWQGGWGPQDDHESVRTIHYALDRGINWIDTAAAYGLGRAETVVGKALRGMAAEDAPYVFTKCGLVWEPGGTTVSNVLAPASIRQECEDSLRRLGVECIDLYQVHWPTQDGTPVEDSWATMAELVDEGKVRYIGVSNFEIGLLEQCHKVRPLDSCQPELNLVARQAAEATLPWCVTHGVGVIVYSPMRSGLLTGAFSAERVAGLPTDDWRATHPDFLEPALSRNLDLVSRLESVASSVGCSVPELAVAWTLAWPGVNGAIVGARRPEQVDGWLGAASVELSPSHLEDVRSALVESGAGWGPVDPTVSS